MFGKRSNEKDNLYVDQSCRCAGFIIPIAGWAVALTWYINHSAKHRKMADLDPLLGSQNT